MGFKILILGLISLLLAGCGGVAIADVQQHVTNLTQIINGDLITQTNETEVESFIFDGDNNGSLVTTGDITANSFSGDGTALTGVLHTEVDGSTTNELQTLSFNNISYLLSISSGNSINLSALKDLLVVNGTQWSIIENYLYNNSGSLDINETKLIELVQLYDTDTVLNESQVDAFVSNNGYLTSEVDGSTTNELQVLIFNSATKELSIEDRNTVNLSSIDTDTVLNESQVDAFVSNNGYLLDTGDTATGSYSFTDSDSSTLMSLQQSGSGTTLNILNSGSGPFFVVDTNKFYIANSGNVGIGTATPSYKLDVVGSLFASSIYSNSWANVTITESQITDLTHTIDTVLNESQVDAYVSNNGYLTSEVDGSTTNELQNLSFNTTNKILSILYGNSVNLSSINTDSQTLSTFGSYLFISGGNSVDLSYLDTVLNESQVDAFVSNNGYLTSEVDGSITNELQNISFNSGTNILSIDNGNSVNLSTLAGGGGGGLIDMNWSDPVDANIVPVTNGVYNLGAETYQFGDVWSQDVFIYYLKGVGDTDTYLQPSADRWFMYAGGIKFISLLESTTDEIIFNDNSADINFRVESDTDANLLFTDGGTNKVGIGTATPSEKLEVNGNISAIYFKGDGSLLTNLPTSSSSFSITKIVNSECYEGTATIGVANGLSTYRLVDAVYDKFYCTILVPPGATAIKNVSFEYSPSGTGVGAVLFESDISVRGDYIYSSLHYDINTFYQTLSFDSTDWSKIHTLYINTSYHDRPNMLNLTDSGTKYVQVAIGRYGADAGDNLTKNLDFYSMTINFE